MISRSEGGGEDGAAGGEMSPPDDDEGPRPPADNGSEDLGCLRGGGDVKKFKGGWRITDR